MILAEAKICTFTLESTHFTFNKCPIYTHDGASAKFRTNSQETDYREDDIFLLGRRAVCKVSDTRNLEIGVPGCREIILEEAQTFLVVLIGSNTPPPQKKKHSKVGMFPL